MSYNPFTLEGKNIIITGASSGIGAQTAIDCSRMGANVILIGRNIERLNNTLSQMHNIESHLVFTFDLLQFNEYKNIVPEIIQKTGKINGLIHCAGISEIKPLQLISIEDIERFNQTNIYTGILLTKYIANINNHVKNECSIVFISSIMGVVGESGKTLYSLTKGALIAGVKSLACELSKKRIRVNAISPGAIITPINENAPYIFDPEKKQILTNKHLLGLGSPEDISNGCIYLLSDAAKWVTGTNLIIDGGYTAK